MVYRCDICKKVVLLRKNVTIFGQSYVLGGEHKEKPERNFRLDGQLVTIDIKFGKTCGDSAEICDACAGETLIKMIKGSCWDKKKK